MELSDVNYLEESKKEALVLLDKGQILEAAFYMMDKMENNKSFIKVAKMMKPFIVLAISNMNSNDIRRYITGFR